MKSINAIYSLFLSDIYSQAHLMMCI